MTILRRFPLLVLAQALLLASCQDREAPTGVTVPSTSLVEVGGVVTHEFTGTVTSVTGPLFGLSPSVGQQLRGSITYDVSRPPAFNTGTVAGYIQPPPSGMSVVIGGATVQSGGDASLQVVNNLGSGSSMFSNCATIPGPLDNVNGFFGGGFGRYVQVNGQQQAASTYMWFSLSDFNSTALSSTALPTSLALESFSRREGCMYDGATGSRLDFRIDPPAPPTITVTIDVQPGSSPNSVMPDAVGVIPVAILTTAAFDATSVHPASVRFGAAGTEAAALSARREDVGRDGDLDVVLHFRTQETGIQCGHTTASLTGAISDGRAIEGSDAIVTVGCR